MINTETSIVAYETEHGKVELSPQIVRNFLVNGDASKITNQEVVMFLMLCKHQRLNPFLREAYLIKYGNEKATIVTGKEVFTKRAAQSDRCTGWEAGIIVRNAQGQVEQREGTFLLPEEKLVGGWAKVYRRDWKVPVSATVSMAEYERKKADGTPMASWKAMPATMIRKVALVQGLREAFPEDFQDMYTPEEMPIDVNALSDEPIQPVQPIQGEVVDDSPQYAQAKKVFTSDASKANSDDLISKPQAKRMFALADGDSTIVKDVIKAAGFEKTEDIPKTAYEALCAEITEQAEAKKNTPAMDQGLDAINLED